MSERTVRQRLEDAIERAIDLLNWLDGDEDLESTADEDQDQNPVTLNPKWEGPARQTRHAAPTLLLPGTSHDRSGRVGRLVQHLVVDNCVATTKG